VGIQHRRAIRVGVDIEHPDHSGRGVVGRYRG
jgi:hypothetical protein